MHKLSIVAAALTAFITVAPAAAQSITYIPNLPKKSTYECHNELGFLRRVHEEELDQVEDANRVSITAVCAGEDYGLMRSEGNAGVLRLRIADNDAMLWALRAKNFGPDDVVGIRMTGDDTVILYVHPFHH